MRDEKLERKAEFFRNCFIYVYNAFKNLFYAVFNAFSSLFAYLGYGASEYKRQTGKPFSVQKKDSGAYGEYLLYRSTRRIPGFKRWVFNAYFDKGDGKTTEADMILVSSYGVFVFESKNYKGDIYGYENARRWFVSPYKTRGGGKRRYSFENPVMQNRLHLRCVKEALSRFETAFVYPLVVFTGRCGLFYKGEDNTAVKRSGILKAVKKASHGKRKLSLSEINQIYSQLLPYASLSEKEKSRHIEELSRFHTGERHCPLCGGEMKIREAKKGKNKGKRFWGCVNYPGCTYTENI